MKGNEDDASSHESVNSESTSAYETSGAEDAINETINHYLFHEETSKFPSNDPECFLPKRLCRDLRINSSIPDDQFGIWFR